MHQTETWLFCESCFVSRVLTGLGRLNNFYFCCQLHEKIGSVDNKKNVFTWFSKVCILRFNAERILETKVQVFLLFYSLFMSGLGTTLITDKTLSKKKLHQTFMPLKMWTGVEAQLMERVDNEAYILPGFDLQMNSLFFSEQLQSIVAYFHFFNIFN